MFGNLQVNNLSWINDSISPESIFGNEYTKLNSEERSNFLNQQLQEAIDYLFINYDPANWESDKAEQYGTIIDGITGSIEGSFLNAWEEYVQPSGGTGLSAKVFKLGFMNLFANNSGGFVDQVDAPEYQDLANEKS
jgi:hypothetical protein